MELLQRLDPEIGAVLDRIPLLDIADSLAEREVPVRHAFRGWGNSVVVVDAALVTGGVPVMGWFGMT